MNKIIALSMAAMLASCATAPAYAVSGSQWHKENAVFSFTGWVSVPYNLEDADHVSGQVILATSDGNGGNGIVLRIAEDGSLQFVHDNPIRVEAVALPVAKVKPGKTNFVGFSIDNPRSLITVCVNDSCGTYGYRYADVVNEPAKFSITVSNDVIDPVYGKFIDTDEMLKRFNEGF